MATKYALRFTKDINGTKDVKCPSIEVIYTHEFSESAEDKMAYEYFNKNALKRVNAVVEKALKPFDPAIKDAQTKIDTIRKHTKDLKTEKDWNELEKHLKELKTFVTTAEKLLAQGVKTIQGLIETEIGKIESDAAQHVKKKLKRDLTKKKWKKGLKVVLMGTLTVAAAAAGIAATIATAGTGLAAVAAVGAIVVSVAGTYKTISESVKKDWENESKTVSRIQKYFEELKANTGELDSQLKALEQYQKSRQKKMKDQAQALGEVSAKFQNLVAVNPEQQKAKKAIADAVKKAETAMKKMEELDQNVTDLIKLGQQTRQYLGPLGSAASSAGSVSSKMKSGAVFLVEQGNTAVTIRDNLKNFEGGTKAGSVVVAECAKILKAFG